MSTDLYGIRVLEVEPEARRVRVLVFVVYYDTHGQYHQPVPEDISFFFRVLWDKADTRFGGGGSLGKEVDVDAYLDESFVDSNAWRFVERVEELEVRNFPVENWEGVSDFYYERGGAWVDEDKLVQADFDVFVTDARYIDHLTVGMSWGTTSYETQADRLRVGERIPDVRLAERELFPFSGPRESGTPEEAQFSPCGGYLAVTSQKGDIAVYSTADFSEIWRLETDNMFPSLAFAPDKPVVVFCGDAYRLDTGEPADPVALPGRIRSANGRWRAGYGDDGNLELLDENGEGVDRLETDLNCVEAVCFLKDEKSVLLAGMGETIQLWDLEEKTEIQRWASARVSSMSLSPDDQYVAVTGYSGRAGGLIRVLRLSDQQMTRFRADTTHYLGPTAWSPDGTWLAMVNVGSKYGYGGHISLHRHEPEVVEEEESEPADQSLLGRMRRIARENPVSGGDWTAAVAAHQAFLDAGGGGGTWSIRSVGSLPMAIYEGPQTAAGKQLAMRFVDLTGVSARDVGLASADLIGCRAAGVDFSGADLAGAMLANSDLSGAIFTGAKLEGADLTGADLSGAIGISRTS